VSKQVSQLVPNPLLTLMHQTKRSKSLQSTIGEKTVSSRRSIGHNAHDTVLTKQGNGPRPTFLPSRNLRSRER
jgi:hypothetical protein